MSQAGPLESLGSPARVFQLISIPQGHDRFSKSHVLYLPLEEFMREIMSTETAVPDKKMLKRQIKSLIRYATRLHFDKVKLPAFFTDGIMSFNRDSQEKIKSLIEHRDRVSSELQKLESEIETIQERLDNLSKPPPSPTQLDRECEKIRKSLDKLSKRGLEELPKIEAEVKANATVLVESSIRLLDLQTAIKKQRALTYESGTNEDRERRNTVERLEAECAKIRPSIGAYNRQKMDLESLRMDQQERERLENELKEKSEQHNVPLFQQQEECQALREQLAVKERQSEHKRTQCKQVESLIEAMYISMRNGFSLSLDSLDLLEKALRINPEQRVPARLTYSPLPRMK